MLKNRCSKYRHPMQQRFKKFFYCMGCKRQIQERHFEKQKDKVFHKKLNREQYLKFLVDEHIKYVRELYVVVDDLERRKKKITINSI